MNLRHDSSIDGFEILHTGNHGMLGNPHPQLSPHLIYCDSVTDKANQTTKWFETDEIPYAYCPQIKIEAIVYARNSEASNKVRGIIDIEIYRSETSPNNFYSNMVYQDLRTGVTLDGTCFTAYVEHKYSGNSLRECNVIKLYYNPQNSNENTIIVPIFIDVCYHKPYSIYKNTTMRYDNYNLLSNTGAVTKSSITDTLIGTSTLHPSLINNALVTVTSGTTVDMSKRGTVYLTYSTATTITGFTGGTPGQTVTVIPTNSNITFQNNSNFDMWNSVDVTPTSYKKLYFVCISANIWSEISRKF